MSTSSKVSIGSAGLTEPLLADASPQGVSGSFSSGVLTVYGNGAANTIEVSRTTMSLAMS